MFHNIISGISGVILINFLWVCIHWSASRIYPYFCAPDGLMGLMLSPFVSQAPHCTSLFWLIETSKTNINQAFTLFATFVTLKVTLFMNKVNEPKKEETPKPNRILNNLFKDFKDKPLEKKFPKFDNFNFSTQSPIHSPFSKQSSIPSPNNISSDSDSVSETPNTPFR